VIFNKVEIDEAYEKASPPPDQPDQPDDSTSTGTGALRKNNTD
jgi:hypothetical protein